jgi:hypothetical protein
MRYSKSADSIAEICEFRASASQGLASNIQHVGAAASGDFPKDCYFDRITELTNFLSTHRLTSSVPRCDIRFFLML